MKRKVCKTRVLPLTKLRNGMVLAESIYTHGRMMLIPAGRVVDDEVINTLIWFTSQKQMGRRVAVVNDTAAPMKASA